MLVLSRADVLAALTPGACAAAMAEVLAARAREETHMPLRTLMRPPRAAGLLAMMPAWRGATDDAPAVFSLKAIGYIRGNPRRGLDTHQGLVMLFDGETAVPQAVLDAAAVTELRTAAVTAVATDVLARSEARVLAVLGAGVQARSHVRALAGTGEHAGVREFEAVRVYAPRADHVRALCAELGELTGPPIIACASAEESVRGADVIVTATNATEPVLERGWLAGGAHVNAVGASTPDARELDTATVAAAAVFVDSRESLRNEAGEYQLAVREGAIPGDGHVRAELGEVLAGQARGRGSEEEITLFRSLGLAVEDLAAAQEAVARARRHGIGTEVPL